MVGECFFPLWQPSHEDNIRYNNSNFNNKYIHHSFEFWTPPAENFDILKIRMDFKLLFELKDGPIPCFTVDISSHIIGGLKIHQ